MLSSSRPVGFVSVAVAMVALGLGCSESGSCATTASCPAEESDAGEPASARSNEAAPAETEPSTQSNGPSGLGALPTLPPAIPTDDGTPTDDELEGTAGTDTTDPAPAPEVTTDADASATDESGTEETGTEETGTEETGASTSETDVMSPDTSATDVLEPDIMATDVMSPDTTTNSDVATETDSADSATDEPEVCVLDESSFDDGCVLAP